MKDMQGGSGRGRESGSVQDIKWILINEENMLRKRENQLFLFKWVFLDDPYSYLVDYDKRNTNLIFNYS